MHWYTSEVAVVTVPEPRGPVWRVGVRNVQQQRVQIMATVGHLSGQTLHLDHEVSREPSNIFLLFTGGL